MVVDVFLTSSLNSAEVITRASVWKLYDEMATDPDDMLEEFEMTDQPETCRKCGSWIAFEDSTRKDTKHYLTVVQCLNEESCGFRYKIIGKDE